MNPFALLEKLINEHGSATVLKERLILIKEELSRVERARLALEQENARLRDRLSTYESGEEACPKCRKRTFELTGQEPDKAFGPMGVLVRTYTCSQCGYSEPRSIDTYAPQHR